MQRLLAILAVTAAAVFFATDEAAAQRYYGGVQYGTTPSRGYYGAPHYDGGWHGRSYYPGGFGVQTFQYSTTLPGGGVYGYSYNRPGYYGAFRSPSYGMSYTYPGYYYRPGYFVWFNN